MDIDERKSERESITRAIKRKEVYGCLVERRGTQIIFDKCYRQKC